MDKAVAAAKTAGEYGSEWRNMDASKRGLMINKLADLIDRDRLYIAVSTCILHLQKLRHYAYANMMRFLRL